jgi:hypothetical protein
MTDSPAANRDRGRLVFVKGQPAGLGVDGGVILTPPCVFCVDNQVSHQNENCAEIEILPRMTPRMSISVQVGTRSMPAQLPGVDPAV